LEDPEGGVAINVALLTELAEARRRSVSEVKRAGVYHDLAESATGLGLRGASWSAVALCRFPRRASVLARDEFPGPVENRKFSFRFSRVRKGLSDLCRSPRTARRFKFVLNLEIRRPLFLA
jgi:hypothetical protein